MSIIDSITRDVKYNTSITNIYDKLQEELNKKFSFCWKAISKKKWKDRSNCVRSSKNIWKVE